MTIPTPYPYSPLPPIVCKLTLFAKGNSKFLLDLPTASIAISRQAVKTVMLWAFTAIIQA
jgi:hypothetical protein